MVPRVVGVGIPVAWLVARPMGMAMIADEGAGLLESLPDMPSARRALVVAGAVVVIGAVAATVRSSVEFALSTLRRNVTVSVEVRLASGSARALTLPASSLTAVTSRSAGSLSGLLTTRARSGAASGWHLHRARSATRCSSRPPPARTGSWPTAERGSSSRALAVPLLLVRPRAVRSRR